VNIKKKFFFFLAVLFVMAFIKVSTAAKLTPVEELGKNLFFDTNLSTPAGQSCAACHAPEVGWTGPLSAAVVYEGAMKGRFGNRKPPASGHAGDSPIFHQDEDGNFVGGMFWDGRATGAELKDPLAEQAGGPFLNPLEQNNPDKKAVVLKVRSSDYAALFEQVWKIKKEEWEQNIDKIYEYISRSIAAFERSEEVNPYNSKFDLFWKQAVAESLEVKAINPANRGNYANLGLGETELKGLMLFNTKGKCANCHVLTPGPNNKPPVFTDYKYDNIGVPGNPGNPFYAQDAKFNPDGKNWVDEGLGGYLKSAPQYAKLAAENMGKHKVPTLRNVDLKPTPNFVKTYMHNGVFKSLKEVVHFYNARDNGKFPPPEVKANLNTDELGNLGLTDEEENAIVDFLKTLNDHFVQTQKQRFDRSR
jgi:cytochrome c peroxidase